MMRMGAAIALASVMASTTNAYGNKEQFIVKEDPRELEHKTRVQATSNQYCAIDREDVEVCIDFALGLKIGWEFNQVFFDYSSTPDTLDGYYDFTLSLYTQQEGNVEFLIYVQRLIEIYAGANLSDFKFKADFGFFYNYATYHTCIYGLVSIEDFFFRVDAELALVQFYKNVIENLWTLDNWSSPYALWFDEIELSTSESIELYKIQVSPLTEDIPIYGTTDYTATTTSTPACIPGIIFTGEYDYLRQVQENLISYFQTALPQHASSDMQVSEKK